MKCNQFSIGDYVSVVEPNGRLRTYGTVTEESYSGYWVKFPNGASALIPSERLRHALKVSSDPRDVVSVPKDKVAAAQQEFDALKLAQISRDSEKAELAARKTELERQLASVAQRRRAIDADYSETGRRMGQLKTFLELAATI